MDRTERFHLIDQMLTSKRVVTRAQFLDALEVSPATFKRDLEYLRRTVPTETGMVLGPFAPGTHAFELVEGRRVIGRVRATVRAGRTTPLVIPR